MRSARIGDAEPVRTTQNNEGNHNLRTELRKLRTLQLIESTRPIQDMRDGVSIDLKDYVRLTGAGRRERLKLPEAVRSRARALASSHGDQVCFQLGQAVFVERISFLVAIERQDRYGLFLLKLEVIRPQNSPEKRPAP